MERCAKHKNTSCPMPCPVCLIEERELVQADNKRLKEALEGIWPFVEEDFPRGMGKNHNTCAAEEYRLAAKAVNQALTQRR